MTPADQPRRKAEASQLAESVLLPAQKSRDIEMIVFRDRRAGNRAAMRLKRARGARRLRARLSAARIGRSRSMGPLKRRHRRRGRGARRRSGLPLVARDPECRQLLQQRPAARFRRGDGVLPLAHRAQLVLRQLRQVLDLRHAGRPNHRLLGRGRNEFLLRRVVRFKAGLDRLREGGVSPGGVLMADERSGGGRRVSLG